MGVTKRLAAVLAVCAALIMIVGFTGGNALAIAACVVVNLIVLVLVIYDIAATPRPSVLEVSRELDERLSLNHVHGVRVVVRNTSDTVLKVEIHDDVPEHLEHGPMPAPQEAEPHRDTVYEYSLKPLKRGEYVLECVNVRYPGVLGLIRRKARFATPEAHHRVYPNMSDLSEYNMAALSRNLLINGIRRVRTNADGGEFNSLRPYAEGDNYRHINWAATARSGSLAVNTYTPERNQYIYVMLDASRVMNSEFNNIKILDYGINAAFLLSDYCIRGGDNIGLEVFSASVSEFVQANKGTAQFELLADRMYGIEFSENAADYDRAAAYFAANVNRRSLVFVFTQLFNTEEALRFAKAVKARLGRHLVCAITISDPRIADIAAGDKDVYMRSAALKFVKDRRRIAAVLEGAGIMNIDTQPDKLSLTAVSAYLNIKKRGIL